MTNDQFITGTRKNTKTNKCQEFVSVVILGENHGYRMKSYGPLPLISIHNKTVLERQVDAIKAAFTNYEIIVCTGFESDRVATFIRSKFLNINIRVVENQIHFNSNCCESVRLCINNTTGNRIMFCGGGVLINPSHLKAIDFQKTSVLVQPQGDDTNFEIGTIQEEGRLGQFTVGVKGQYWTEILYINGKDCINSFRGTVCNPEFKNRFMFEAINAISYKHHIEVVSNTLKRIIKIDNLKSLRKNMKI